MSFSDYRKQVQSILSNAGLYHGDIDGKIGSISTAAFIALRDAHDPVSSIPHGASVLNSQILAADETAWSDARSEGNIGTLHPNVRPYARAVLRIAKEHGITAKVTSGTRTADEQNALYEQGRTAPGKIVTNARAWQSNHNYGLAFDLTVFDGGAPKYEGPEYKTIGQIGESLGLVWGGRWTNDDEPHLELYPEWANGMTEGQLISALHSRHNEGRDAFA